MRHANGSGEQPVVEDEAVLLAHLRTLLQLRRWTEAKTAARALATRNPGNAHYRALLALARGNEAAESGAPKRAREEWRRALTLDPKLEEARDALASRIGRQSWVERLFRR